MSDSAQLASPADRAAAPLPARAPQPTAGPSADDRSPIGDFNGEARIVGRSVVGNGRVRLLIAAKGVIRGATGTIKGVEDSHFVIESITEGFAVGITANRLDVDAIVGHTTAIISSLSRPDSSTAAGPIRARIVGRSVDGGATRILLSAGTDQGVAIGMSGHITDVPDGRFEIDRVDTARTCSAMTGHSGDTLIAHRDVVIND